MSRLTVIAGPMFCGKSSELIRRVRRARLADQYVEVFVPSTDTRSSGEVITHAKEKLSAVPVREIAPDASVLSLASLGHVKLIAFDEAQFFSHALYNQVRVILDLGIDVVVAGLDLDYLGEPFGSMADYMCIADEVVKLTAVCVRCKGDATRTFRTASASDKVLVGASEAYEARCKSCWKLR